MISIAVSYHPPRGLVSIFHAPRIYRHHGPVSHFMQHGMIFTHPRIAPHHGTASSASQTSAIYMYIAEIPHIYAPPTHPVISHIPTTPVSACIISSATCMVSQQHGITLITVLYRASQQHGITLITVLYRASQQHGMIHLTVLYRASQQHGMNHLTVLYRASQQHGITLTQPIRTPPQLDSVPH